MPDPNVFDRSLPSPLAAVAALRCSGEDSVVATNKITRRQEAMYVATGLDDRLRDRMLQGDPPSLVVLGGSAGGGKSALIRTLQRSLPAGTFTQIIEDATHAEAPDQDQTRLLADALDAFRLGVPSHGERILIAANTGLLLRLQRQFHMSGEAGLAELVAYLLSRLGVPAAPRVKPDRTQALDRCVLVVDLDQRPTSGAADRLLQRMLASLDPQAADGILGGAIRCESCQVRQYCAPRTNLELLSDPTIGRALDEAVEQIALLRGRDVAPRQLWDGMAELALGGIAIPPSGDPCDSVAELAASDDKLAVWRGLLPCGPLSGRGATGALTIALSAIDPSYQATAEAHEVIAATGVDPDADAERLLNTLGGDDSSRMAVLTAAEALTLEDRDLLVREVARGLIRAQWLSGHLPLGSPVPPSFLDALLDDHDAAREVINLAGRGLISAFGHTVDGADYLPTEGLSESRSARVLVRVDLAAGQMIDLRGALAQERNPEGSAVVGARPLTARLTIGAAELILDYGLYRLLRSAADGTIAATLDIERYLSLRYAAETLGRRLGNDTTTSLLVLSDSAGAAYRVSQATFRGRSELRIAKVG